MRFEAVLHPDRPHDPHLAGGAPRVERAGRLQRDPAVPDQRFAELDHDAHAGTVGASSSRRRPLKRCWSASCAPGPAVPGIMPWMDEPSDPLHRPLRHPPSLRRLLAIAARRARPARRRAVPRRVAAGQRRRDADARREPPHGVVPRSPTGCARAPTTSRTWSGCTSRPAARATARYYDEILAIRAGRRRARATTTARSGTACWPSGKGFVRYGPPQSLTAQMRAAHFAPDEFRALQASLNASNGLAEVERGVIARVARRIDRGVDARYSGDVRAALRAAGRRRLPRREGPDHALDRPLHRPRRRAHAARGAATRARTSARCRVVADRRSSCAIVLVGVAALVILTAARAAPARTA